MKLKLTLISLAIAGTLHAQLIDLTPGGYDPNEGLPPAYFELQEQIFFDEAAHGVFQLPWGEEYINDWVSLFGELDGGTYFFTNLFRLGDTPSAPIWWDFRQTENGLTMIHVYGRKPDGTAREHIYRVQRNKIRRSPPVDVTLDGMTFIQSIAFYGMNNRRHSETRRPAIMLRHLEQ